jgi:hypothetical protein
MVWKSIHEPWRPVASYFCPCCKYRTLQSRGDFEICKICFWEDDGQDEHDADVVRGGPNYHLSLRQAQANFAAFGATEERFLEFVRPPREDEERELKK